METNIKGKIMVFFLPLAFSYILHMQSHQSRKHHQTIHTSPQKQSHWITTTFTPTPPLQSQQNYCNNYGSTALTDAPTSSHQHQHNNHTITTISIKVTPAPPERSHKQQNNNYDITTTTRPTPQLQYE